MCEGCKVKEDEYLLEIRKDNELLVSKRVCEECFQIIIEDED